MFCPPARFLSAKRNRRFSTRRGAVKTVKNGAFRYSQKKPRGFSHLRATGGLASATRAACYNQRALR
jgi:hypothetical protein